MNEHTLAGFIIGINFTICLQCVFDLIRLRQRP